MFKTCKTIFNKAKSSEKNLEFLEVEIFDGASKELIKLKVTFANRASVVKAGKIFQHANWNKYQKTQKEKVDTGDQKRCSRLLMHLLLPLSPFEGQQGEEDKKRMIITQYKIRILSLFTTRSETKQK